MKIVLASASERRQELLVRIVEDFTVLVSEFDENSVKEKGSISQYVEEIAFGKAKDVASRLKEGYIVIAADTIVAINGEILGKPINKEDAFKTLNKLSGNTHKVYTGLVLINTSTSKILKSTESTEVIFSKLSKDDISKYIDSGEPMDKAGAYGIQGMGGVFVEGILGCYYNVVGLPLNRLHKMIKQII